MGIASYAESVRDSITQTPNVLFHSLAYEDRPPIAGLVKGTVTFADGSRFHRTLFAATAEPSLARGHAACQTSLIGVSDHYHETRAGTIIRFSVQLEVLVQDHWKPVIRYDCAHGFAHCDRFTVSGNQRKENLDLEYEEALSFADDDIDDHWETYRAHFTAG